MLTGFHHVALSVADLDRSIAFYREHFGMEQAFDVRPFAGERFDAIMGLAGAAGRMSGVTLGNLTLELFEFDSPEPAAMDENRPVADRGITHFGVWVEDIEAMQARMAAAGVRFHSDIMMFGPTKATYGRDPDGNVFELVERTDLPKAS